AQSAHEPVPVWASEEALAVAWKPNQFPQPDSNVPSCSRFVGPGAEPSPPPPFASEAPVSPKLASTLAAATQEPPLQTRPSMQPCVASHARPAGSARARVHAPTLVVTANSTSREPRDARTRLTLRPFSAAEHRGRPAS